MEAGSERLRNVLAYIRENLTQQLIELITRDVGFTDEEAMSRVFVRLYGHPPLSGAQAMKATSNYLHSRAPAGSANSLAIDVKTLVRPPPSSLLLPACACDAAHAS